MNDIRYLLRWLGAVCLCAALCGGVAAKSGKSSAKGGRLSNAQPNPTQFFVPKVTSESASAILPEKALLAAGDFVTSRGLFRTLSSSEWFTFGAPYGKVRLSSGSLRLTARGDFDMGGHAGAIWRKPIQRPASGERYVYVWGLRDGSVLRPGRAHIVLTPENEELSELGAGDYFGLLLDVSPSRRRFARMIQEGDFSGYHSLAGPDSLDIRFALTPQGQRLELKFSGED
ncbi:MAG: hypothetical protein NTX50_10730, partial [Candidatus Sumerlaeota bacterium]|nr:hypothetical protein [Candidatus Sumerlaeota bacterium]